MVLVSGYPLLTASLAGGGAAVLSLAAAATLRHGIGFALGWITQLVAVGLGLVTTMMFAMGGLFALLWVMAFVLGRRLENAR